MHRVRQLWRGNIPGTHKRYHIAVFRSPLWTFTVYPKKYVYGFVVLCFVVVMQSFIMNSHEVFIHIHHGCFAGTGAIVRLPLCQWSKPDEYGKISQCITTTKHSKAKTVCIFLGIYCIWTLNWLCYKGAPFAWMQSNIKTCRHEYIPPTLILKHNKREQFAWYIICIIRSYPSTERLLKATINNLIHISWANYMWSCFFCSFLRRENRNQNSCCVEIS